MPAFDAIDFVSFYIEIPVMILMYLAWASTRRRRRQHLHIHSRRRSLTDTDPLLYPLTRTVSGGSSLSRSVVDLVDADTVDLYSDEYDDSDQDRDDEKARDRNLRGRWGALWRIWYFVA